MLKFFQIMLLFCPILLVIWGCATLNVKERVEMTIDPSGSYEDCVELLPAQILEYSFKASKPVKFNIHYHGEKGIFYPISKDKISSWSGVIDVGKERYYSKEQEYFCLMWDNPHSEHISLTYEYEVKDK